LYLNLCISYQRRMQHTDHLHYQYKESHFYKLHIYQLKYKSHSSHRTF